MAQPPEYYENAIKEGKITIDFSEETSGDVCSVHSSFLRYISPLNSVASSSSEGKRYASHRAAS